MRTFAQFSIFATFIFFTAFYYGSDPDSFSFQNSSAPNLSERKPANVEKDTSPVQKQNQPPENSMLITPVSSSRQPKKAQRPQPHRSFKAPLAYQKY